MDDDQSSRCHLSVLLISSLQLPRMCTLSHYEAWQQNTCPHPLCRFGDPDRHYRSSALVLRNQNDGDEPGATGDAGKCFADHNLAIALPGNFPVHGELEAAVERVL